jgi:hypothetical protein
VRQNNGQVPINGSENGNGNDSLTQSPFRCNVPLLLFLSTVQDLIIQCFHYALKVSVFAVQFRRGRLPALPTSLKIEDDDPISLCETVSGIVCDQLL